MFFITYNMHRKKKTAKTPSREIERAKRYRADYESKEV